MNSSKQDFASFPAREGCLINPHRLFHGVWLPQWLEERVEVSEKAKKLYAYLTYFAGGKGCSWPSFGLLAEKLHCSRPHVMRLVRELSTHRLIAVTNVSNPERGHCAKSGILGCRMSATGALSWLHAKANLSMLWENRRTIARQKRAIVTSASLGP